MKFSDAAFCCPDLLFKPQINDFQFDGIDKTIFDSIMKCDNNIFIKGLPERIAKELKSMLSLLHRPNMQFGLF